MSQDNLKSPPLSAIMAGNEITNSDRLSNILERASQVSGVEFLADIARNAKNKPKTDEKKAIEPIRTIRDAVKKPPKAIKNERNRKKVISGNRRLVARLKAKLGHIENPNPTLIPVNIWLNCKVIVSDATGRAVSEFSNQISNKIALSRIHRAALQIDKEGRSQASYRGDDPSALRARRVFTLGYLLLSLATKTARKDGYRYLVKKVPQAAMIAALRSPNGSDESIYRTSFSGTRKQGQRRGEIGYLDALKKTDFCYTRQAKWRYGGQCLTRGWSDMQPEEIAGRRGEIAFSLARYWIVTDRFTDVKAVEPRQILSADCMAGFQPVDAWVSGYVHEKTSGFCPSLPRGKPPN